MNITISKKDATRSFSCVEGEKMLYAGLRQGLCLPYECATGTCGTCKAKLKAGELDNLWPDAPGAAKLKTDRGEFLMCQNAALVDCEISFPGRLTADTDDVCMPAESRGTIVSAAALTRDVIRFEVELEAPIHFRAGQFVVLSAPGLRGARAYSMVNYGPRAQRLEFIIKRLPGGGFTQWMFDQTTEGAQVGVFGPLGKAVLGHDEGKDLLCITGGSGIAGVVSLLTQAAATGYLVNNRASLFFGVRTQRDVFFESRLENLARQSDGNLAVTIVLSEEDAPRGNPASAIAYAQGFVTPVAMDRMAERFSNTIAFVAGPPPMVDDALRQLIMDAEIPAADLRYDKFS